MARQKAAGMKPQCVLSLAKRASSFVIIFFMFEVICLLYMSPEMKTEQIMYLFASFLVTCTEASIKKLKIAQFKPLCKTFRMIK